MTKDQGEHALTTDSFLFPPNIKTKVSKCRLARAGWVKANWTVNWNSVPYQGDGYLTQQNLEGHIKMLRFMLEAPGV